MFVLDTNIVSELRKARSGRMNPRVAAWADSVPPSLMFLSVITIQELERGVLLVERRDPSQGMILREWLDVNVMRTFVDRIIDIDVAVARRAAALHVPDRSSVGDALIVASALVHGMAVVTRNVGRFERHAGLEVIDPWKA